MPIPRQLTLPGKPTLEKLQTAVRNWIGETAKHFGQFQANFTRNVNPSAGHNLVYDGAAWTPGTSFSVAVAGTFDGVTTTFPAPVTIPLTADGVPQATLVRVRAGVATAVPFTVSGGNIVIVPAPLAGDTYTLTVLLPA